MLIMTFIDLVAPKRAVFSDLQTSKTMKAGHSDCERAVLEIHGAGATRCSVPALQNCLISR